MEPSSEKFIKPLIGAREFLYNEKRYCLWLVDASPSEIKEMKFVVQRIKAVKEDRGKGGISKKSCIDKPHLFGENRQPRSDFLVIPKLSSENRRYIPMGFFSQNTIITDLVSAIPNATLYHFGTLSSINHMVWVKYICGRMKSDFRYTNLVYNNFPWPENPTEKQVAAIEFAVQRVLEVRKKYQENKVVAFVHSSPPTKEQFDSPLWQGEDQKTIQKSASLADLYDSITMPLDLVKAHNDLDKAVDQAYRSQPFTSEAKRMEFLFELYEKYTADLFTKEKLKRSVKKAI